MSAYQLIAIGGGPAGLGAAIEWIEMGGKAEEVLILEKGPGPIDAIKIFYPEKKMTIANYKNLPTSTLGHLPTFPDLTKAETITYFDKLIEKYRLNVRYQTEVFKVEKLASGGFEVYGGGEKWGARFVAIGIGILGRPKKPDYKIPAPLKSRIWYDLTTEPIQPKEKILIVGGGDTSSEYAQILIGEHCDVTLILRAEQITKMMDQNREAVERLANEGKLTLILKCQITQLADKEGKPEVSFDHPEFCEPMVYDRVIFSLGGSTPINFLKTCGIESEANWPKVGANGETNIEGLYLTGDLAVGKQGGSIITAYNSAFRSVTEMRKKL